MRKGAPQVEKSLWKKIQSGVTVDEDRIKLEYNGPRTLKELFAKSSFVDVRPARIGGSTVMRTRPRFQHPWYLTFHLLINRGQINPATVRATLEKGGSYCGIGDYTPKFGRFSVMNYDEV